ncbi:DUF1189 domain-containing protein [Halalkalibacter krulwichiae]|uniref:DUF1189 domain-containing protein n=1 Tax=Halalkalibacter krulwichiae TaxID=199441 RepID=UPI00147244EC|nr:DUF1189 domain-containing protein [Halalkalibacter krulwichiae]
MITLNFWEWFIKSFYNKKVIAYSRFRPITTTIGYVLFIVFVASVPYFISFNTTTYSAVEKLNNLLLDDLPAFQISDGRLQADIDDYYYSDELNEGVVIIDPTNSFSEEQLIQLSEAVVLQRDQFFFVSNGTTQTISYTLLGLNELSKDDLSNRFSDLQSFLPVLLVILTGLLYSGLAGLAYLGISLLAVFALVLKGNRPSLQYRQLWSITAHALTLPVILLYWMDSLLFPIPFSAFFLSTLIIVLIAVWSIPKPKQKAR